MMRTTLLGLLILSNVALASSDVTFPVNHNEVKPYPGRFEFILNDQSHMHDYVFYTITCHLNNPSSTSVPMVLEIAPYLVCPQRGGCSSVLLNGKIVGDVKKLIPGTNTITVIHAMTAGYNKDTKMAFVNYDNDISFFVDECKAVLE